MFTNRWAFALGAVVRRRGHILGESQVVIHNSLAHIVNERQVNTKFESISPILIKLFDIKYYSYE